MANFEETEENTRHRSKLNIGDKADKHCTHPSQFQRSTVSVTLSVVHDQTIAVDCWYVVRDLLWDTEARHFINNSIIIHSCGSEEEARRVEAKLARAVEAKVLEALLEALVDPA